MIRLVLSLYCSKRLTPVNFLVALIRQPFDVRAAIPNYFRSSFTFRVGISNYFCSDFTFQMATPNYFRFGSTLCCSAHVKSIMCIMCFPATGNEA